MIDIEFMKMYLKYGNMHHKCINCAVKCDNNHIISSVYCMILIIRTQNLRRCLKLEEEFMEAVRYSNSKL